LGAAPAHPKFSVGAYVVKRPKCAFTFKCDYFPETEILVVEFTAFRKALAAPPFTGRPYVYYYEEVPEAVANDWFANDCDGVDYNFELRGQPGPLYAYTRVT